MVVDAAISILGLVLILLVLSDFVRTTLRLEGSGRLSARLMSWMWQLALILQRRLRGRQFLGHVGVIILLSNVFAWAILLWLGWLLLFLPHRGSVIESSSGLPADFWSNVYYVGYSLITLGVGDFAPNGPLFQVATVFASMSGFFLFTLSVTYLVPVVAAVVQARQLAAQTFLLGNDTAEMTRQLLADGGVQLLQGLSAPIVLLAQNHFAYPVLQYFPSSRRSTSSAVALAVLDESLALLFHGLDDDSRFPVIQLQPLRRAIDDYLERHVAPMSEKRAEPPPPPSLAPLRAAGATTVSDEEFARRLETLERRRSLLRELVEHEDRAWETVLKG